MTFHAATDRRVRKTRKSVVDAFIQLVHDRPYDSIRVADVLRRADVGRSTFYAHFRDKDDLLARVLCFMYDALGAYLRDVLAGSADDEGFARLLAHFRENRVLFRRLTTGRATEGYAASNCLLEQRVAGTLEAHCRDHGLAPALPVSHVAAPLAQAMLGLLREWLVGDDGDDVSPRHLCGALRALVGAHVETLLQPMPGRNPRAARGPVTHAGRTIRGLLAPLLLVLASGGAGCTTTAAPAGTGWKSIAATRTLGLAISDAMDDVDAGFADGMTVSVRSDGFEKDEVGSYVRALMRQAVYDGGGTVQPGGDLDATVTVHVSGVEQVKNFLLPFFDTTRLTAQLDAELVVRDRDGALVHRQSLKGSAKYQETITLTFFTLPGVFYVRREQAWIRIASEEMFLDDFYWHGAALFREVEPGD